MSQGNDFANYSAAAAGSTESEDVWFVAVASDDIKQMNVDQLDEAYRLGIITADTAVWTDGMDAWAPLGNGFGNGFGHVTLQSVPHSFSPGPSSISPVTSSYSSSPSYAPSQNLGLSTGPVALNVDEDMPAIRHGRRFRPERWALAAAALVAVGVVAYNNMFSSSVAAAGTQAPATTALAARPYDGADGAESRDKLNARAAAKEDAPAPVKASDEPSISPAAAAAAAVVPATKAAALAASDDAEAPSSARSKASDKESLKGSFSKAFNNKKERASSSRASKDKPRKAASRATTKPRATKAKKSGVVRAQSAFDPLNDSLP